MYLGTLCMGADVAGGLIAFHLMTRRRTSCRSSSRTFAASSLKRAEDDVHFVCEDGAADSGPGARAPCASGEREEATVHVTARVPKKLGDEPVAQFELTLSVKKR